MKCYRCKKEIRDGVEVCPSCGAPQVFTADLIALAIANDQNAISQLYEMTYNNVYLTIRMMVKDEDTCHDLLQDAFLRAFRNLSQLEKPEAFRGWIKRIAHNLTVDYLRKKKPQAFSSMVSTDSDEMMDFEDERLESMPEEVIDYQETKRLLGEIMDTLPEEQRAVISLHYYEGIPVKEIARILDVSENTVKSRLSYGRKKIELEVKALEKKGTKLYGLAPIPFLLFLFRSMDAQAAELPDTQILQNITQIPKSSAPSGQLKQGSKNVDRISKTTSSASKAGVGAAKAGAGAAKAGAGIAGKGVAAKIIAGIVAVAVVGGGVGAAVAYNQDKDTPSQGVVEAPVQSEPPTEPVTPEIAETPKVTDTPEITETPKVTDTPNEPSSDATNEAARPQPEIEDRWTGSYGNLEGKNYTMKISSSGNNIYQIIFIDGAGNHIQELTASLDEDIGLVSEDGSLEVIIAGRDQMYVESESDVQGFYLITEAEETEQPHIQ